MAEPAVIQDQVSVVVRGHFNPAIFSPAWLLSEELVGIADYDEMKAELVSQDLTILRASQLDLQITRDALQVSGTKPESFEVARDLVVGILTTLRHTPISLLGINRHTHFSVEDEDSYNRIGDILAPKAPWLDVLPFAGLLSMSVVGSTTSDYPSRCTMRVEQSTLAPLAIFVLHNDHFTLKEVVEGRVDSKEDLKFESSEDKSEAEKLFRAIVVLQSAWDDSMNRAQETCRMVWGLRKNTA